MTHICVGKLTIIGSDNGLSPGRCQAIIWTNAGILLIRPLGTNFNEILIEIHTFSFKKMHLKMSSAKWRPFCLGLNVLMHWSVRDVKAVLQCVLIIWANYLSTSCKLVLVECHRTSLMVGQHCSRWWLGAVSHQPFLTMRWHRKLKSFPMVNKDIYSSLSQLMTR